MTQNEYSATGGIRLNGTESPVTIFTTGGSKAIVDGDVSGFSMSHYKVTGDPDESKVVYTYFMNLPPTGDTASPLLWSLLAAVASCAAVLLLRARRCGSN